MNPEELKRLLDAATPGPWAYRPDPYDDWGVVKSPPREVGNYEPPLILRTALAQMRDDRRLDEEALNECRRAGTDPWEANARLVVFLRNNAPAILALVEENARLREARDTLFDAIKHGDQEHQDWLRDAIGRHFNGEPK